MHDKIKMIVASQLSETEFREKSLTAKSLLKYADPNLHVIVATNNYTSLGTIYNSVIEQHKDDPAILVFIHDDVLLLDYHWPLRIKESLKKYDVVGIAGSKIRFPYQQGWGHKSIGDNPIWADSKDVSGIVGHGSDWDSMNLTYFGELDQEVKLLDGVLLAVHSDTLHRTNVRFDPQFDFHFYDMDFCRSVEQANLRMGTCPLAIMHAGKGSFASDPWQKLYSKYIEKWKE
jgi:GT2 family glycosyltransferase